GQDAVEEVRENPYRLAYDIAGIGFLTADRIAFKLGFEKNDPLRIKAGILYVLHDLSEDGHVYYPYESLIGKCEEILEVEPDTVAEAIAAAAGENLIVIEDINPSIESFRENQKAVYLARFHVAESWAARHLKRIAAGPKAIRTIDTGRALSWVQQQLQFVLAEKQNAAIASAVKNKAMVITGGPGTGKTTIIRAILHIFQKLRVNILLAAPTGRAAKRMSETTGHRAGTIHRMLSYNFAAGGFQKNESNPLACDLLIVDEASMIDTVLMYHLLKAVPSTATLVIVGDVNQLPSVGPGNVLKDIIASGAVPVVELSEIFRQARASRIVVNAHKINQGVVPKIDPEDRDTDFYFIEQTEPDRVVDIIVEIVSRRIPSRFGFDAVDDIQVLSPMHKGAAGTGNLNAQLQASLNPKDDALAAGGFRFCVDDKVMQIRNNYDKQVFNGDIGRIAGIAAETREVTIDYDGRGVAYDFNELDEVVPAYAVSVHKSQGSEFPVVVMPILTQHYILLQRNLIYTGITRGRRLVVLVGTKKALAIAVKNDKPGQRYTRLAERLRPKREKERSL
ncbi:MAG: SF1B family DNA helicase RecD2, partial [Thermodesulfobacteriota bacterium]